MKRIALRYDGRFGRGLFSRVDEVPPAVWLRLRSAAVAVDPTASLAGEVVDVRWTSALELLRMHAGLQRELGFMFEAQGEALERVARFMGEFRAVRQAAGKVLDQLAPNEVRARLAAFGWDDARHELKPHQTQNVSQLLALPNGANFSVPGAGKTTVTFALQLLLRDAADCMLVVAPRNAFAAWDEVVSECLRESAHPQALEPFTALTGGEARIQDLLLRGGRRFIISYDQLVRVEQLARHLLATRRVHLVLDESHRMKAGAGSRRGSVLLGLGHLAVRRDILSGTPMPQTSADLQSQMDFLWPGAGLGSRISMGEAPRQVIEGLFVRTTKQDLDLEPRRRESISVTLTESHLAFYSVLKDDVRARVSVLRRGATGVALAQARRSVIRLMQAAVNPEAVATNFHELATPVTNAMLRVVLQEGPSARVLAAVDLARQLAGEGRKVLLWTIFTATINRLTALLEDLQPALIYGATGVGDEADDATRQGQIRRFKTDASCMVMVANPAAASEGMSLHIDCHDAIYVDRSYNATHFLQSIDRIHRLGLPRGTVTTTYVLENKLPFGVGSIDQSVARRLATKIRAMEQLLGDRDLHELALDEEENEPALDETISLEDIDDLIRELESGRADSGDPDDLV
jgi:SNF2 family DNA or RNA helicase